ncbi:MAG: NAD-dependent epimerase/dehydratase family protein [Nanoarchaeota archaeon]
MTEHHVVFGASGGLGNAVIRELVSKKKQVRGVCRSGKAEVPEGVDVVEGDLADVEQACKAAEGATVIYNCANPNYTKWNRLFPPLIKGSIDAAAKLGAKLVYGDNLYMYGEFSGQVKEDHPSNAKTKKGKIRAYAAEEVLAAHRFGKVQAVIGRASDFYGPNTQWGELFFRPALIGKTVSAVGNLDAPHTYMYVKDFAKGLVMLAEADDTYGEVWHVPSARPITTREFLQKIYQEANTNPKIRVASRGMVNAMSLINPMMREIKEMLYQWEKPFVVDDSKFEKRFSDISTSHTRAIKETIDWYMKHPQKKRLG